ncbi:MAG: hypothetical protein N2645_07380 [Clostridia bacterium]|nr:hypothetical protein [Clostridia bacterium]
MHNFDQQNNISTQNEFQSKPQQPLRLQFEMSYYHLYLLVSLSLLLFVYLKPWTKPSLEKLTVNLTINLFSLIFGGIIVAVVQFLPAILCFVTMIFIIKNKNAKILSIVSTLSMLAYWSFSFVTLYLMKNALGGSFKFHFYLFPVFVLLVLFVAIFSPGKNKILKLDLVERKFNAFLKGMNILLFGLLLLPWIEINSNLEVITDYGRIIEQASMRFFDTNIGFSKIVLFLKASMLTINIFLKFIPLVGILFYLILNRRTQALMKLNKITVFYNLALFVLLWNFVEPIEFLIEMTDFLYLSLVVSFVLLGASIVAKFTHRYNK